ncbi:MAG: Na(+)-translocating NADH-quinone reductase subunit F [Flavobacteriaceae bacterium]|nr:MAG: Na(+)-translocating NADH-quinone reductase subunit F [Flavobacteriaceae bacterium]
MKKLSEQELHNLAMNIVGRELEAQGYEFMAVNSSLKKNPQFVCIKEKQVSFIVVRAVIFSKNPKRYDEVIMKKIKKHAAEFNAEIYYAGVGLANTSDDRLPLYLNEEYIVEYEGPIKI